MAKNKLSISRSVIEKYLSERERTKISLLEFKRLGSGWHGTGYRIVYKVKGKTREAVLRTINPLGFSHDHASDRASSLLLQNKLFNSIPRHVRSIGVGGLLSGGKLVSIGDAREFFQIVEVARGTPYVEDLERILKSGKVASSDVERAVLLSDYLAKLHKTRFRGSKEENRSLRLRHLRDVVGHGEMLMGVIDTYPEKTSFATGEELADLICLAAKFSQRIKNLEVPLVKMHGDYHPGNIWFEGKKDFTLLDASREGWGLPADDMTALTINYIRFALLDRGEFEGPFKELFMKFWENYLSATKDEFLDRTAAPFFAFRGVVVAHPHFYPDDGDDMKKKMMRFVKNVLLHGRFDPGDMNSYLEVK